MNLQFVKGNPYFTSISKVINKYSYLDDNLNTDVVIVGGGITGAILAYYFSKSNINVVLLEKDVIGYCSTSITTALLEYELDSAANELMQYTSKENVLNSYRVGVRALKEIDKFINEYGNNINYSKRDTMFYTGKECDIGEIEREYIFRREHGFDVSLIDDSDGIFQFKISSGVIGNNGGMEIDPYKFTHELLKEAKKLGAKVFENTEVVKVNYTDDNVEVVTKYDYKVNCKKIIVATGYNTRLFTDRDFGVTTKSFNIVTKPIENLDKFYNKTLIRDNKDPYNYLRATYDNRIIIGGEDVDFITDADNEALAEEKYSILESRLKQMFPEINIEIEYKYGGAFTSTQDNLGFIGEDPSNKKLWYCLGYGANGILFSINGGIMLSKLYKNEIDEYLYLFKVNRFDN